MKLFLRQLLLSFFLVYTQVKKMLYVIAYF